MRIVQITDDFPPFIGGMAAHAWELSKALVRCGHSVSVLTGAKVRHAEARFALPKRELLDGVEVTNLGFSLFMRRYHKYSFNRAIKKILSQNGSESNDVVLHIHEHMRQRKIRELADLPLVWTNHSSMFLDDFEDDAMKPVLARNVQACDWITAPSHELCEKTISLGYPDERLTYIPNGVDTLRFTTDRKPADRVLNVVGKTLHLRKDLCVILCSRRFVYKNGLHIYLDALESMPQKLLSKCAFLFAGNNPGRDGEYGQEIFERIKALRRKTVVHVLGPVPNDSMPNVYRAADIAVLPSLKEATSISGLEAMATGLPIVGTNVGGIPEIVENGINGLLYPADDRAALAKAITILVNDEKLRLRMGLKGRWFAEKRFSWDRIAEKFIKVYQRVLAVRQCTSVTK